MNPPKNILVPIDFSPFSEHALDYAVPLATKLDAKVHLFNAVAFPPMGVPELGVALAASIIDETVRANQVELAKLADARRGSGTIAEVLVRTGDARDLILQTCEAINADLIVMGTHGRRGVSRAVLGSVAESVVRTAPCPVMTIRAPKGSK